MPEPLQALAWIAAAVEDIPFVRDSMGLVKVTTESKLRAQPVVLISWKQSGTKYGIIIAALPGNRLLVEAETTIWDMAEVTQSVEIGTITDITDDMLDAWLAGVFYLVQVGLTLVMGWPANMIVEDLIPKFPKVKAVIVVFPSSETLGDAVGYTSVAATLAKPLRWDVVGDTMVLLEPSLYQNTYTLFGKHQKAQISHILTPGAVQAVVGPSLGVQTIPTPPPAPEPVARRHGTFFSQQPSRWWNAVYLFYHVVGGYILPGLLVCLSFIIYSAGVTGWQFYLLLGATILSILWVGARQILIKDE